MRSIKLGTGLVLATALVLSGGTALAGVLTPNVLQGDFFFDDGNQGANNCANIQVQGATHQVNGTVTGVSTTNDTVTIAYATPFVDRVGVKAEAAGVAERSQVTVDVDIVPPLGSPVTAYTGTANPNKCKTVAKTTKAGTVSRVGVSCNTGVDLGGMTPAPDTAQMTAITEAFDARKDVLVKAKNGRVVIRHKGATAAGGTCP